MDEMGSDRREKTQRRRPGAANGAGEHRRTWTDIIGGTWSKERLANASGNVASEVLTHLFLKVYCFMVWTLPAQAGVGKNNVRIFLCKGKGWLLTMSSINAMSHAY